MNIPKAIDNQTPCLVDVATDDFLIHGFGFVQRGLETLGSLHLLLEAKRHIGKQIGFRLDLKAFTNALSSDPNREPWTEVTLRLVKNYIRFLRKKFVLIRFHGTGFVHAQCFSLAIPELVWVISFVAAASHATPVEHLGAQQPSGEQPSTDKTCIPIKTRFPHSETRLEPPTHVLGLGDDLVAVDG